MRSIESRVPIQFRSLVRKEQQWTRLSLRASKGLDRDIPNRSRDACSHVTACCDLMYRRARPLTVDVLECAKTFQVSWTTEVHLPVVEGSCLSEVTIAVSAGRQLGVDGYREERVRTRQQTRDTARHGDRYRHIPPVTKYEYGEQRYRTEPS